MMKSSIEIAEFLGLRPGDKVKVEGDKKTYEVYKHLNIYSDGEDLEEIRLKTDSGIYKEVHWLIYEDITIIREPVANEEERELLRKFIEVQETLNNVKFQYVERTNMIELNCHFTNKKMFVLKFNKNKFFKKVENFVKYTLKDLMGGE